jgi:antitoxin StbD
MDRIMTELTTTISEFKKNPNAVVKKAKKKPFAVLTNNKPTFYVLSPELYDEMEEILWEIRIAPLLKKRMASKKPHIEVKFEDLMDL